MATGAPSSPSTSHAASGGFSGNGSNNKTMPTGGGEGVVTGGISGRAMSARKSRKAVASAAISSNEGESGKGCLVRDGLNQEIFS